MPAALVPGRAGGRRRCEVFHKDGYTDLRGRFDYASVSGRGISEVERFAILAMSETSGALVAEAAPPGN